MNLEKKLKNFKRLSLIYIDCDLYEPTLKILKLLTPKLSKNDQNSRLKHTSNFDRKIGPKSPHFGGQNGTKIDQNLRMEY